MVSRSLFRKYAIAFAALVATILVLAGIIQLILSYRENESSVRALETEKAVATARQIEITIDGLADRITWAMLPLLDRQSLSGQRFEFRKLLREVPAITEIAQADPDGKEVLRVSRVELDTLESGRDLSREESFLGTRSGRTYFGPIYLKQGTSPYMTVAVAPRHRAMGAAIAEVDLRFIWDLISRIRLGETGYAYVVDARGNLIAHPDPSLVLKKTDLSALPQLVEALGFDEAG